MIKSFYIHNFKSIKDLTVELAYNAEKAPNGYKKSDSHIFIQTGSKSSEETPLPVEQSENVKQSSNKDILILDKENKNIYKLDENTSKQIIELLNKQEQ